MHACQQRTALKQGAVSARFAAQCPTDSSHLLCQLQTVVLLSRVGVMSGVVAGNSKIELLPVPAAGVRRRTRRRNDNL